MLVKLLGRIEATISWKLARRWKLRLASVATAPLSTRPLRQGFPVRGDAIPWYGGIISLFRFL